MNRFQNVVIVTVIFAALPYVGYPQRLYDKARDEQAQKALELAEPLKSAKIFEAMLQNLAGRTKLDFETEFLAKKFNINADSLSVFTWNNAHQYVCRIQLEYKRPPHLPSDDEIKASTKEVKDAIATSKKSLAEFECSIKDGTFSEKSNNTYVCKDPKETDPTLTSLFDRLGDFKSIVEFSEKLNEQLPANTKFNPKTLDALTKIKETIQQVQSVYDAYTSKVKEYNALAGQLGEMRLALKKIALQSLQVDEEHLKNIAAIKARLETEQGEILALVSRYKGYVSRLELASQESSTGESRINQTTPDFCDVYDITGENNSNRNTYAFRNNWVIVEHLKEMVQHAQRLERDNRDIQSKAKLALLKLNKDPRSGGVNTLIKDTIESINVAKINIDANEIIHARERQLSCPEPGDESKQFNICLTNLARSLEPGNAPNDESKRKALQNIIEYSYVSTIENRNMVADVPQAIYDLAALIARGDTPIKLAQLRTATEDQAYSIRKSAVRARAYELAVSAGSQRLSLFYKGGIKPETIAQLVFAISNAAIPPAILAK